MSGGSESSSSSTNTSTNTDKRLVVSDTGVGVSADGSSKIEINALDGGAFEFANDLGNAVIKSFGQVLDFAEAATKQNAEMLKLNTVTAQSIAQGTQQAIEDATKSSDNGRYLVAAGLAVVGIVAVKVWGK